ncbi:MAG TPA: hypothetical protein VFN03_10250, partial [Trueperaceae bacterium]|nr:hypothetical protein [Trueperaceae bacterium]
MTASNSSAGTPARPHHWTRSHGARLRRLLTTALLLSFGYVVAQECTYEIEPNDQVSAATVVTGAGPDSLAPTNLSQVGEACISGALGASDADQFVWKPGALEAGHRWTLTVEGQPGQDLGVTLAAAVLAEDGRTIISTTELLEVSTPNGARVASPTFLINDGTTYVLQFSGAGGEYVAGLRPVSALRYGVADERFDEFSPTRATESPFKSFAVVDGEITQTFTVPAGFSGFEWDVELWAALGSDARFTLDGPSGQVAAGAVGAYGYARAVDLTMQPGVYTLTVAGTVDSPTTVRYQLEAAGKVLTGAASEPNDTWVTAGLIRPGDSVTGDLAVLDYYRLEIDESQAGRAWDVTLDSEQDVRFGIRDQWGRELRESRSGAASGLTLQQGAYRLVVEGPTAAHYRLSVAPASSVSEDDEPNDSQLAATP